MQPLKSGTKFGQVPHPHGTIGFAPEGAPSPQGASSLIGLGVRPPSAGLPRRLDIGEKPGGWRPQGRYPRSHPNSHQSPGPLRGCVHTEQASKEPHRKGSCWAKPRTRPCPVLEEWARISAAPGQRGGMTTVGVRRRPQSGGRLGTFRLRPREIK